MRAAGEHDEGFQSTPLIRGETLPKGRRRGGRNHFNPLPSYEGRHTFHKRPCHSCRFQSTPLIRGETSVIVRSKAPVFNFNPLPSCEGRHRPKFVTAEMFKFQSTPLMRGETRILKSDVSIAKFQSTPLIRGETAYTCPSPSSGAHFNPLPSHEGRRVRQDHVYPIHQNFNPLPSHEGRHAASI